jgi:pimeloyl-ACP methyl ester carboxylesterase
MASIETNKNDVSSLHEQRNLTKGVVVILSGGPFDWMNPPEVRNRMNQIITDVNADPWVVANTQGKGLTFRLLEDQQNNYIHQASWREICESPHLLDASPLIVIGHSNGGAAAMNVARFLHDKGKDVDLLFTADSVLTLDDNGDPYQVPSNVRLNLNSYSIPVFPVWWTAPFPFGQKNRRQSDGSLAGILNIGLRFEEPGALEHRDVFYDVAGGDSEGSDYQYPELIRDTVLAVLQGATNQEIFQLSERYLQVLADGAAISINLDGDGLESTLQPNSDITEVPAPPVSAGTIANLHERMSAVEKVRLGLRDSPDLYGIDALGELV